MLADLGVFNDELEFQGSAVYRASNSALVRAARWCIDAPYMNHVIRKLESGRR